MVTAVTLAIGENGCNIARGTDEAFPAQRPKNPRIQRFASFNPQDGGYGSSSINGANNVTLHNTLQPSAGFRSPNDDPSLGQGHQAGVKGHNNDCNFSANPRRSENASSPVRPVRSRVPGDRTQDPLH